MDQHTSKVLMVLVKGQDAYLPHVPLPAGRLYVRRCLAALLLTLALGRVSDAAIDLTGDWYTNNPFGSPLLIHFAQAGTCSPTPCQVSLEVSGALVSTSGSIDPGAGYFGVAYVPSPPSIDNCGFSWHAKANADGSTFAGGWDIYFTSPECHSIGCVCGTTETFLLYGSRSPCGNGNVDPGEECDDGNLGQNGNCCDLGCTLTPAGQACAADGSPCTSDICDATATCTHPVVPNDTSCSDGRFCNGAETCQDGVCESGAAPCQRLCDEANQQCVTSCPAPQTCRTAEKSLLVLRNTIYDGNDRLIWKWIRGARTSQSEFGDPTATADYALCIYAGTTSALVGESIIPASGNNWSAIRTKGYRYADPAADQGGIAKILLKGGDQNTSRVLVKGKGAYLPDLPLPIMAPLIVQLLNGDNGLCWGAEYSGAELEKNETGHLKAKAP